jgi:hypothetical protein
MTPGEFLRAVWPATGVYCIATPFIIPGSSPPKKVYAHKTFDDISAAVSYALNNRQTKDLFFAVHTLKEHSVFNPEKLNQRTNEMGASEVRVQRNMKESRAFFFDLDVGEAANKYQDQIEAGLGLRKFCEATGLPKPLIVSSGGGLHVYWTVTEPIESNEWRSTAMKLKQLAHHYGLKIDPARTTDVASVLRVAGTFNFKDRSNPKPVKALDPVQEIGNGVFVGLVDKAMITAGVQAKALPQLGGSSPADILGSNTAREYDGPPVSLKAVLLACKQMQRLVLARGNVTEPEWYHGIIGVGRFLEDGHRRVHQMSQGYSGYDEADTTAKIKQHESRRDAVSGQPLGPTSCAKLAEISSAGDEPCIGCPFAGKVHGPVSAARYKDPAPAPEVMIELVGANSDPVVMTIPDPPEPFMRMKGGGIAVNAKNADGENAYITIYEHDLYPIRRLTNPQAGIEQNVWHVELPRGEAKDFILDAEMLYDPRKFTSAISNQGIYPHKSHIPSVQEYMVAYIQQLQKLVDADAQSNHLGWSEDFTQFILPEKILTADGKVKTAQLSTGAQRSSAQVHTKGNAQAHADLLKFYNHPEYIAHQFFILAGLAAPIFYATGQHGVIVNASGESGASKSTSLYTAASFWGHPELYPINGTNNGATIRGRNERVTVLANLPVGVDEITHMKVDDAVDLAMSITQPGHRIRLETSGHERAHIGSYKSTIMLTTANNSLHGLLSQHNAAGTAGSMRVFEIKFPITRVHTKKEADTFKFALRENYGHLGERFIAHIITRLDAVVARVREVMAEIDAELNIQASERFWSATIAAVLVTGEIARELGMVAFDIDAIRKWALEVQVPEMRGIVREEYSDPLAILTDFLAQISPNMVVIDKSQAAVGAQTYMSRKPIGPLFAHYDKHEDMIYVLRKAFKDHCARIGANALKVLDDLHKPDSDGRIVAVTYTKRTLGAGTEYAKGQSSCFAINVAHREMSGTIDLKVIEGGGEGAAAPPPGLHVVQ